MIRSVTLPFVLLFVIPLKLSTLPFTLILNLYPLPPLLLVWLLSFYLFWPLQLPLYPLFHHLLTHIILPRYTTSFHISTLSSFCISLNLSYTPSHSNTPTHPSSLSLITTTSIQYALLKVGDMVKIDLGAHMDGYIVVAAHTVIVKEAPVAGNTHTCTHIQTDAFSHYFLLFLLVYFIPHLQVFQQPTFFLSFTVLIMSCYVYPL